MAQAETKHFSKNLAVVCAEHGSIQDIADKSKLSRVYVSKLIHGKAVPSLEVASRIAEAAGLTLKQMLETPETFARKHGKKFAVSA